MRRACAKAHARAFCMHPCMHVLLNIYTQCSTLNCDMMLTPFFSGSAAQPVAQVDCFWHQGPHLYPYAHPQSGSRISIHNVSVTFSCLRMR